MPDTNKKADTLAGVTASENKLTPEDNPNTEFVQSGREIAEPICNTVGVCKMGQFAKTIGWGPNRFIDRLRADQVLMKNNSPFQKYIDQGYFQVVAKKPWRDSNGNEHPTFTTMITGRGQEWLRKRYAAAMIRPAVKARSDHA